LEALGIKEGKDARDRCVCRTSSEAKHPSVEAEGRVHTKSRESAAHLHVGGRQGGPWSQSLASGAKGDEVGLVRDEVKVRG
jgi:hypothetical protein